MGKTFKIGLMGCGVVADYGHLPAIKEAEGLDLFALFEPNPERLAAMQKKHGVPHGFTDVESFFRSGIEAVAITSPAPAHLNNVLDAARYGLPVLCEKPLAMNDAEAEQMIAAMRAARRLLVTGFCYRFSPSALEIKSLLAEGAIGRVRSLRLIYNWHCHGKFEKRPDGLLVEQARRVGRMLEGGPMVDCGVHQIDLARWWTGAEVVRQCARGAWVDSYDAPDHCWLHMDHANGVHTMVEMSYSFCHTVKEPTTHFTYQLIGDRGVILYTRDNNTFELRNDQGTRKLEMHHEKDFTGMYRHFARALSSGDPGHLPTGEDGLAATRIARNAVEEAMRERVKV